MGHYYFLRNKHNSLPLLGQSNVSHNELFCLHDSSEDEFAQQGWITHFLSMFKGEYAPAFLLIEQND